MGRMNSGENVRERKCPRELCAKNLEGGRGGEVEGEAFSRCMVTSRLASDMHTLLSRTRLALRHPFFVSNAAG